LTTAYPQLFTPRKLRRIVLDRSAIEHYAEENRLALGLVAETPHVYFIVDLVEALDHDDQPFRFPYLRLVYRKQLEGGINTVVIGTIANPELGPIGSVVVLRQERHATGEFHLELPRGFGEVNLNGEQNALKELREETGYTGTSAELLGTIHTDTGVTDAVVSFYHVPITGKEEPIPEREEAIEEVLLFSVEDLRAKIRDGEITDSFTLQAVALLNS
jgi:ADP-ribose pyrophosphatase